MSCGRRACRRPRRQPSGDGGFRPRILTPVSADQRLSTLIPGTTQSTLSGSVTSPTERESTVGGCSCSA